MSVLSSTTDMLAAGINVCKVPKADIWLRQRLVRNRPRGGLAVLLLTFISFVAGLVANTNVGRRVMRWFENSFLGGLPQYQVMKSMAEGLARVESAEGVQPALVSIEDGWQIAYLLEPLENGWVAVFLPQAPTPMSGNVMYLPADRVRPLNITMVQAMAIVKHIGVGSAEAPARRRPQASRGHLSHPLE